ncbi:MAG: hypothetical protein IKY23_12485 [Lachnospiraceae bacterium]|nr:hypothetical protein [Lachnospiraceae bacterium]
MCTEKAKEILKMPEEQISAVLSYIRIVDKRLCKSLILKLSDKKRLLHDYRIPFWCRGYSASVFEEKLAAILELNIVLAGAKKEEVPKSEYLLAEEFFRIGKYDEARKYILISAKNGDQRAINLIKLLEKTQKNSFKI